MFEQDIEKILFHENEIKKRVEEIGQQITHDYAGQEVTLICLLNGAVTFMADLARLIELSVYYEFMSVSSYDKQAVSSGNVRIIKDVTRDIRGKNIIIVEDIVDTGLTLDYIYRILNERGPRNIKICSFLDKKNARKININVDYVGFTVPEEFIVGYGLDYAQKYRNLPYVGVLKKTIYDKT